MSAKAKSSLLNALFYQIGWFACVLGAATGWGRAGGILAIALALVHLLLAERPGKEWPLMLAAVVLGVGVEWFHTGVGILDLLGHQTGSAPPIWILGLWLQFATTLHFSLGWLSKRYLLATLLGLIGGPLAFLGGERLGAAAFGDPRALSLGVIALAWAIALPVLVRSADRLGGVGRYKIFGGQSEALIDLTAPLGQRNT